MSEQKISTAMVTAMLTESPAGLTIFDIAAKAGCSTAIAKKHCRRGDIQVVTCGRDRRWVLTKNMPLALKHAETVKAASRERLKEYDRKRQKGRRRAARVYKERPKEANEKEWAPIPRVASVWELGSYAARCPR